MRVADYIIEFLENQGVGHIFTVVGGGSIFLNDALGIAKKMKYVACHHAPHLTISGQVFLAQTIGKNPGFRTMGVQEINIVDIV